ncbi:hypothetical protein GGTG_13924 [Gaeumannomyces tritici R3-111a-1]|uniref:Uncharacterized protein n=1 Tax=Gaeumannomyces tritici (strain R3-111a-1) TaxID=644352 RepID=J3PK75_GAET3|nr:hypothetical protein GGTG_13924 [Gaeumannomyces tritici R3-111a-1]EJT68494.1 hypothetical protein GGTG_13924 [Gaeumannomyces tritici R3-111a-1]
MSAVDIASIFQASETAPTSQTSDNHSDVDDKENLQPSDPPAPSNSDSGSVISNFEQPLNPSAKDSIISLLCGRIQNAIPKSGGHIGAAGSHPGVQVELAAKLRDFVKSMQARAPKLDRPDRDGLKLMYFLHSDIARRLDELMWPKPEHRLPTNLGNAEPMDGRARVEIWKYDPQQDDPLGPPADNGGPTDGVDGAEDGGLGDIFVNRINARDVIDHLTADPAFDVLVSEVRDILEQYAKDKLEVIRTRISDSFASRPSHDGPQSRPHCARFQVGWDLEGYLRANYDNGVSQNLNTIVATVGVLPKAQLCTIGEYFKQVADWETHETELLNALQQAIHKRKTSGHEQRDIDMTTGSSLRAPSLWRFADNPEAATDQVTEPVTAAGDSISVNLDSNTIDVEGSEKFIVVVAQQLGWLVALTYDNCELDETKYAYVRVKKLPESETSYNPGPLFDVTVNLERPPQEDESSGCWTAILGHSVLITGYPTNDRQASMLGLEASPQTMASLARIPVAVTFGGGFVFKVKKLLWLV